MPRPRHSVRTEMPKLPRWASRRYGPFSKLSTPITSPAASATNASLPGRSRCFLNPLPFCSSLKLNSSASMMKKGVSAAAARTWANKRAASSGRAERMVISKTNRTSR